VNLLKQKKNTECPISREKISDEYVTCSECNYNFDYINVVHWLELNDNCPMCRNSWTNYTRYIRTTNNN
jgi:hypothetical protein